MLTTYKYNAGSTLANILADITALLTGETNKVNLSTDCNQAGTVITSTIAAGWTVHDGATGTAGQTVFKLHDGANVYGYAMVDLSVSGRLLVRGYEAWDAATHTGTNPIYKSDDADYGQIVDLSGGGTLFIGAAAGYGIYFSLAQFAVRTAKTVSASGNAKVSTDQAKFGGASALFDGAGDYLSVPDSADWAFGANNFTVDFWVGFNASTNDQMLYAQGTNSTAAQQLYVRFSDSTLNFVLNGGTSFVHQWTWLPALNTWYHVALVRSGSSWYAFVNGVSLGTKTSSASIGDYTGAFIIGANYNVAGNFLNGYLDEFRVSSLARWTANFTAPSSAYSNDANTLLLIHADGANNSTTFTDDAGGLGYGSPTGNAPCGVFVRTRAAPWDTAGHGYPPMVWGNFYLVGSANDKTNAAGTNINKFFAPRIKGQSGDRTGVDAFFNPVTEFGTGSSVGSFRSTVPAAQGFDAAYNAAHYMHEIALVNYTETLKAGKITGKIFLTTSDFGNAGDELPFNGETYFIMTEGQPAGAGAGLRIAVPKF